MKKRDKGLEMKSFEVLSEEISTSISNISKGVKDNESALIKFISNNDVKNIDESIYDSLRHVRLIKSEFEYCIKKLPVITTIDDIAIRNLDILNDELFDLVNSLNRLNNE